MDDKIRKSVEESGNAYARGSKAIILALLWQKLERAIKEGKMWKVVKIKEEIKKYENT